MVPTSAITVWIVMAWLCFLFPLIEPDSQISRIRLSEKGHRLDCIAAQFYRLLTKGQVWVDRGAEEFEHRRQQPDLASLQRRARSL
jgi:hypothetical protein